MVADRRVDHVVAFRRAADGDVPETGSEPLLDLAVDLALGVRVDALASSGHGEVQQPDADRLSGPNADVPRALAAPAARLLSDQVREVAFRIGYRQVGLGAQFSGRRVNWNGELRDSS